MTSQFDATASMLGYLYQVRLALLVDRTNELYSGHAILLDGSA
jgi:hypothetical protein